MDLSFAFFWKQVLGSPALMIIVFLTLCVIFVNGWTDAPNAIATCVSTRSMDVELAIISCLQFCRSNGDDYGKFYRGHDHYKYGKFWGR